MADEESSPLLAAPIDPVASGNPPTSSSLSSRIQTALSRPASLNGLEKLLFAFAVLFLLISATFIGLFAGEAVKLGQEKRKHHHGDGKLPDKGGKHHGGGDPRTTVTTFLPGPTGKPHTPGNKDEVCMTPTCVTVAASVLTALDESVDPCDDFYRFTNGGWLDSHPIPDGANMFGSAQDIGVRNKRVVLEVLAQPPSKHLPAADQDNINHLRSFWSSCLDEDAIDRQGLEPLLEVVEEVVTAWRGEPTTPGASVGTIDEQGQIAFGGEVEALKKWDPKTKRDRLTASLMFLHSRGIPALFSLFIEGNVAVDPKTLVAWIKQDGLGLPTKDYYKDTETVEVYTEIIRASLKSVYDARNETKGVDHKALAKGVVAFEKKMAKISLSPDALEDPSKTYNAFNPKQLAALFPSISFPNYFASFTPRPDYPSPVIVTSPPYFNNLTTLLSDVEPEILEAYFVFRTAQALGGFLGAKQTVRKEVDWLGNFLGGVAEGTKEPRGDVCLATLLENYGFLIGKYYVEKAFKGDSKEYAEDIIVATIQAFKDRLPELDWLDPETRKKAEEKADAITHKIGYPTTPNTTDASSLARYYSLNLPITKTDYFGNILRSRVADQKRTWVQLGHQMDKGVWDMIPSEVNAYYSPPANEIAFPAGILQAPYFSKDWPEYMAFGAFGSVAGHELSHAFDPSGHLYDKDGKLVNWWTNETTANFESLQSCFLEQYGNYSVTGDDGKEYHINSRFTNGEDMADAGGLAQSFRAWSDRFDGGNEDNWLLPGVKYSREQLFYIAYAQGWARNIQPAEAKRRILTDPHSPTNFRVIGPLSNDENFARAFGCKVGSPMNNKRKCKVW